MNDKPDEEKLPDTLHKFTSGLIEDLNALRSGEITLSEARGRTQLAREVLRSIHLQLEGLKFASNIAKPIPHSKIKEIKS